MAAANYSTTGSLASLIQYLYPSGTIEKLVQSKFTLLDLIPRVKNWEGSSVWNPFAYGTGGGASMDYATAYAHSTASRNSHVLLSSSEGDVFADITFESTLAMKDRSFVDGKRHELDMKMADLLALASMNLWRTSTASLGTIKSGTSTAATTIYLTNIEDAIFFEIGDQIGVSSTDGGTLRGDPTYATVTGVDRQLGTLTFAANFSTTISGATAGDYVYKKGNVNSFMNGIADWIPDSNPSSGESFLSVIDRSVDPSRLAGVRVDGAGESMNDALVELNTQIKRISRRSPDIIVVNDSHWGDLSRELSTFERFDPDKHATRATSYSQLEIRNQQGSAKIVTDNYCPVNYAYGLSIDTWKLYHRTNQLAQWLTSPEHIIKSTSAFSYKYHAFFFMGLMCTNPGANGVVTNFGTNS